MYGASVRGIDITWVNIGDFGEIDNNGNFGDLLPIFDKSVHPLILTPLGRTLLILANLATGQNRQFWRYLKSVSARFSD